MLGDVSRMELSQKNITSEGEFFPGLADLESPKKGVRTVSEGTTVSVLMF